MTDLPAALRITRQSAGLPVQDLAAMLGIKRRQFYNLASGEEPDNSCEDRIFRVANAIGKISDLVEGNSRHVRAALLAYIGNDSFYDAAVSGNERRLDNALDQALAAIRCGVKIQRRLAPSNRARPTKAEAVAMREFLRAARDETGLGD